MNYKILNGWCVREKTQVKDYNVAVIQDEEV